MKGEDWRQGRQATFEVFVFFFLTRDQRYGAIAKGAYEVEGGV